MSETFHDKAVLLARRPYPMVITLEPTTEGETVYLARNPDLDGCIAQGETGAEASANLDAFRIDYIEALLESGHPVPEPGTLPTHTTSGNTSTIVFFGEPERLEDRSSDVPVTPSIFIRA